MLNHTDAFSGTLVTWIVSIIIHYCVIINDHLPIGVYCHKAYEWNTLDWSWSRRGNSFSFRRKFWLQDWQNPNFLFEKLICVPPVGSNWLQRQVSIWHWFLSFVEADFKSHLVRHSVTYCISKVATGVFKGRFDISVEVITLMGKVYLITADF